MTEFSPFEYGLLALVSVVAGAVRGFSGFGLSAILISAGALFVAPATIVPVTFLLEAVASFGMFRSVYRDVDWSVAVKLIIGLLIATPLGLFLVRSLDPDITRVLLSVTVIFGSLLIISGYRTPFKFVGIVPVLTAIFAGFASGLAGLAGLAMMMWILATGYDLARARATLAVVFAVTMIYSFAVATAQQLVNLQTLLTTVWLAPFILAGLFIGKRMFNAVSPERLRQYVLALLIALACIGLIRVLSGY